MNAIRQYAVLEAPDVDSLVLLVQGTIADGWQPLGGPFHASGTYHQAMVWMERVLARPSSSTGELEDRPSGDGELIDELTQDDEPVLLVSEHLRQVELGRSHG
jgi:hypothetical protein